MTHVTADTNIYISALLFGGVPGVFLDLALMQVFRLVVSAALLDELDEKLKDRFHLTVTDAQAIRKKLEANADTVGPTVTINAVAEDPDDNRVLECAVEGHSDYIVSGDRHLLKLGSFQGIGILTVRQFLDRFAPGETA